MRFTLGFLAIEALGLVLPQRFGADFFFHGYTLTEAAQAYHRHFGSPEAGDRYRLHDHFPFDPYRLDDVPPRSSKLRVACMGDSTAWGLAVEAEQTWCFRLALELEARLGRPVETLNFGVPGSTSYIAIDSILNDVLSVEPDVVISSYTGLNESVLVPVEEKAYTSHDDPIRNTLRIVTTFRLLERGYYRARVLALRGELVEKVSQADHEHNVDLILERVEGAGSRAIQLEQWASLADQPHGIWTRARFGEYRARTRRVAQLRGVPIVDVEPLAVHDPTGFFVENHLHYSPAGHAAIATALADVIAKNDRRDFGRRDDN